MAAPKPQLDLAALMQGLGTIVADARQALVRCALPGPAMGPCACLNAERWQIECCCLPPHLQCMLSLRGVTC